MKRIQAVLCVLLGALLGLAGCAPHKEAYRRPAPPAPQAWHTGLTEQQAPAAAGAPLGADLNWEGYFTDGKLRQVIKLALENNRDLRMAALNMERAQAQFRLQQIHVKH